MLRSLIPEIVGTRLPRRNKAVTDLGYLLGLE